MHSVHAISMRTLQKEAYILIYKIQDTMNSKNQNLLMSETNLVAAALVDDCQGAISPQNQLSGHTFSVGCSSGLFEQILKKKFPIDHQRRTRTSRWHGRYRRTSHSRT